MKTVPVVNGPIKPANFARFGPHGQHLVTTNEAFSCINGCKVVMTADISIPVVLSLLSSPWQQTPRCNTEHDAEAEKLS